MIKVNLLKKYKICSREDCLFVDLLQCLESFSKNPRSKDGLNYQCKTCDKKYKEKNKELTKEYNKIYNKDYYIDNNQRLLKRAKKRYEENKKQILEQQKQYYQTHKDQMNEYHKMYCTKNKQYLLEWYKKYRTKKKQEDIQYVLRNSLWSRLCHAIKNNQKSGSAVADLMMSIADFKIYLEKRFYPNPDTGEMMTWENYGFYGWHIDHIIPLSAFDLTNREQFLKAVHYTNLRPMWAKQNLSENDRGMSRNKLTKGFQIF